MRHQYFGEGITETLTWGSMCPTRTDILWHPYSNLLTGKMCYRYRNDASLGFKKKKKKHAEVKGEHTIQINVCHLHEKASNHQTAKEKLRLENVNALDWRGPWATASLLTEKRRGRWTVASQKVSTGLITLPTQLLLSVLSVSWGFKLTRGTVSHPVSDWEQGCVGARWFKLLGDQTKGPVHYGCL